VLRRLDRRRLRVGERVVRIDRSTLTCVGAGPAKRVRGRRAWSRFRCVQPTFPPGSVVGADLVFTVELTGERSFAIRGARLTRY
jgi:hypothetical protein